MKRAVVIGSVNVDITGFSKAKPNLYDSNIATIRTAIGGVGANIAQNLALMGVNTELITAIGSDMSVSLIKRRMKELNIDISRALVSDVYECGKYMSMLDDKGDMLIGFNDMAINTLMSKAFFEGIEINADLICADCNMLEESFEYVLKKYGGSIPIVVDGVSNAKVKKVRGLEKYISIFRPNRFELGSLCETEIRDDKDVEECAAFLIARGMKSLYVCGADKDVMYFDSECTLSFSVGKPKVINATGAGDAFTAAVACAYLRGYNPKQSAELALKASAIALRAYDAVGDEMKVLNDLHK